MECRHTTLKTDHKPLIHVKVQPHLSNCQIRWTQKLGRYNYNVDYKKSITNVAADALSRHPDLQSTKPKFVHFGDQRCFPLVQQHVFSQNDMDMTSFERSIFPPRECMTNSTESMINTQSQVLAPQIGCKVADIGYVLGSVFIVVQCLLLSVFYFAIGNYVLQPIPYCSLKWLFDSRVLVFRITLSFG